MKNKLTPTTVEIKNFEEGFTPNGFAGDIYFNNKRIISFFTKNYIHMIDHINLLDKDLESHILDYQLDNELDEYSQTIEGFVYAAVSFHLIKQDTKKSIAKFKKDNKVIDKLTIGAFIFTDSSENGGDYSISIFNKVPTELNETQKEELKEKARNHKSYDKHKDVYFMKYISAQKTMLEQIK